MANQHSIGLTAAPGASESGPAFPFERLKRPAAWLVVLLVAAAVLFWRLGITSRWEPPYLNVILQVTLVSSISLIISVLAIRSFLRAGNWPVLWLGAGSLCYGMTLAVSNSLLQFVGINQAVTTHNLNVLLVALLQLVGAFFGYNGIGRMDDSAGRRGVALQVYAGSAAAVALVTAGAIFGWLPPFFIQGQGGTPWRQLVVIAAALLFALDALGFLVQYRRSKADFLYWYSLGLLLNSLVMAETLVTAVIGSPLSWLGRATQILGGLYLLVATVITMREARARQLPPEEVLASFFWRDEANLRLLFESIMDAIIVTDERFVIRDWNRAAEQIYGWKATEVVGKPAPDILRANADLKESRAELLRTGSWKGQVLHRRRDGKEIPVLVTVSTVKDATGRVVGTVGVNRDITERVRIEEELRRSEEKTRDLIRYAPTGIYEVDFRTGRFRSINDTMCAILGYTRDELTAMSAFDLLDDESKMRFGERIRLALSGEAIDPTVEYTVIKKDGAAIYAVLSVTLTYTDARPDGAFVIAHDVTERRRAAEQLRLAAETLERRVRERTADLQEANQRLAYQAHLLANINDMLTVTDAQGTLMLWNSVAEELTGWKAEEVLGRSWYEVLQGEWLGVERDEVYRQLDQTGRFRGEIVLRRKDGSPLYTEVASIAVKEEQGQATAFVAVNRDVTERKRAEAELRASREQMQMLSHRLIEAVEDERRAISRELHDQAGQLLTSLMLGVGVLKKRYAATEEASRQIADLQHIGDELLKCMHDLAVSLRPASLDRVGLAPALGQLAEMFKSNAGIQIDLVTTGLQGRLSPEVETAIYRIVQESLTNVARHAQATCAHVAVERQGDRVNVLIEDDGKGFDLQTALRSGSLGLSGMRERAEMLGGKLSIETQPGRGTAVRAELPALTDAVGSGSLDGGLGRG